MVDWLKFIGAVGAVAVILVMLHGQLRDDIRSLDENLDGKITRIGERLDDRMNSIDKRLSRIEGILEVRLPNQP